MRASNEEDYLRTVCRIIVDDCGHAMTWIGFADDDAEKTVRPVAYAGFEDGYLETLHITWADNERGRGPTGTAIRTGKPSFCKNIHTDPKFAMWREEALKRGYASSLVLPLFDGKRVFGALTIYFGDPDPFTDAEVKLLSDLADDLVFGIRSIKLKADHKSTVKALAATKLRLEHDRDIIQSVMNGAKNSHLVYLDRDFNFVRVNQAYAETCGYTPEEMVGKNHFALCPHPENEEIFRRVLDTGEDASYHDKPFKFSDQPSHSVTYWDWTLTPVKDSEGSVEGLIFSLIETTERVLKERALEERKAEAQRAEEASHKSETRFRLLSTLTARLLESENPQAIVNELCTKVMEHLECQTFFNYLVNESAARLELNAYSGIPEDKAKEIRWLDYGEAVCGRVARVGERFVAEDILHGSDERTSLERKFGINAYCCHPLQAHGKVIGTLSFGTKTRASFNAEDIGLMRTVADQVAIAIERIGDEDKIKHAARQWQITFDAIPDLVSIQDKDYKLVNVNRAYEKTFKRSSDDLIGRRCFEVFHQTECAIPNCPHVKTLKTGKLATEEIYEPTLGIYIEATTSPLFNESGELLGTVHVAKDITERRKAEAEIRRYEEHLEELVAEQTQEIQRANVYNRTLIEISPDPLVTINTEGKIADANAAAEIVTGLSRSELIGMDFSDYFTEPEKARAGYELAFREGHITDYPLEILHKEGQVTPVLYSANLYRDENGKVTGLLATARDISEHRQVEAALKYRAQQQAVVASLGQHALKGESLDLLMEATVAFVARTLSIEFSYIMELMPGEDSLLLKAGVGWNQGSVGRTKVNAGKSSQSGYTLLTSEPVIVKDLNEETRFTPPDLLLEHGVVSGMTVIIGKKDQPFGVLGSFSSSSHAFTENDSVFLQAVANVLGQAIERKHAEEAVRLANAYNRSLIEASLDPLVTISPEGKITDVNAATEKATGRKRNHLIGSDFSDYFTQPERAKAGYEHVFREGIVTNYALEIKHIDGHVMPVLYNASMYRDNNGNVIGVFAAARDITDRKKAEDEIRKLNTELEARVTVRTAELEDANKELEAFSYSVSHDLRAPLRSIDGFSLALLEDYSAALDAKAQDYLNRIRTASQSMATLIDDLLELSRVSRHQIRLETIDISKMVEDIVGGFKQTDPDRSVSIKVLPNMKAVGDSHLVRIALQNLVDNAWKFTGRQPDAKIEVGTVNNKGNTAYFIKDNGAGFNPRYRDKLFIPFQRLHNPSEFPGTGIGLATTYRIIKRHGGTVWAEGETGKGAIFYFTLEEWRNNVSQEDTTGRR